MPGADVEPPPGRGRRSPLTAGAEPPAGAWHAAAGADRTSSADRTSGAQLADELRAIGRRAGLDSVGICDAEPFTDTRAVIEERRRLGWSAGMQFTYRNPARSTDPAATLPGARALFVGARSYARQEGPPAPADGVAGRVARYSWVDHYAPLRSALGVVAERLRAEGWQARVLVDDNALVDRAAAVRAGIGWYGKNANVLVAGSGSWFVLGSVVTDAPIAPSLRPLELGDRCGSCHRCIDACPTGALVGPGQVDGRRCLAWLVQAPGVFPRQFRVALGDRMYGCDDCQEVCPINSWATRRSPPPPAEAGSQPRVDILRVLSCPDETLLDWIGRWYIPGRDVRYVRRNALVALGNTGDPTDPAVVHAVSGALGHPDPIIRAHAVWAAARLGRRDLLAAVAADPDPLVSAELSDLPDSRP